VRSNTLERHEDKHYPHWLDLGSEGAKPDSAAIGNFSAIKLRFNIKGGELCGSQDPFDAIRTVMNEASILRGK
jgi:hypothetical protein